ncbi:caspase family protein [Sorangium sp. So ce315]|uniref:caspase family protein n=1 Tax=Sorangium sp. So ce315 TaxID=3133299 RepID=UPI003F638570
MSAAFSSGYALLVGVGGDLPVTARDAEDLAALLRDPDRAGYPDDQVDVLTGAQATRAGILAALDRLAERTLGDPEATAIVYYSGHGGRFGPSAAMARYYLLPHGWDEARRDETGVSGDELTARIRAIPARRLLVLLDCCHAAGLPRPKDGASAAAFAKTGLPAIDGLRSGAGQMVLTSCRGDERSYIRQGAANSVFTACLLEALQGSAPSYLGFAWALDVVSYLLREVPGRAPAPQHPVLSWADRTESFTLCRVPAAKGAAAPAPAPGWRRKRVQMEIDSLMPAFELRRTLIGRLRTARALSTDPAEQLRIERQIDEAERAAESDTQRLDRLHAELGEA